MIRVTASDDDVGGGNGSGSGSGDEDNGEDDNDVCCSFVRKFKIGVAFCPVCKAQLAVISVSICMSNWTCLFKLS